LRIVIEMGREWAFEELPPRSIALDGAVQGPRIDAERQRYSFDHHAGCVRLATSATCQQVLDALLLGLDPTGHDVLVNDLDADSVLAVWLLKHHDRWREPEALARVRPLVAAIGGLDAHGPAYPAPGRALLAGFLSRLEPLLADRSPRAHPEAAPEALAAACSALDGWWESGLDTAGIVPPPPGPQLTVQRRGDWVLAHAGEDTQGAHPAATRVLYAAGHDRLVVGTDLARSRFRYTLARRSDLVPAFPIHALYAALNDAEAAARGQELGSGQTWGGGSSVGGSPRDGSVLDPETLATIVTRTVAEARNERRR